MAKKKIKSQEKKFTPKDLVAIDRMADKVVMAEMRFKLAEAEVKMAKREKQILELESELYGYKIAKFDTRMRTEKDRYMDTMKERTETIDQLKDKYDITAQVFLHTIPPPWLAMKNLILFFPDPIYETHPLHRQWGYAGEMMARTGHNVLFYNTTMTAPYIHEVYLSEEKHKALNETYRSQRSLWKWDHKYFLFEGYNSWKFNLSEVLE